MRKTTTTYACDSCQKAVDKPSGVTRYSVYKAKGSGGPDDFVMTDICGDCEPKFLNAVAPFVPDDEKAVFAEWGDS